MKVFISWSGPLSHEVAEAVRDWLPKVLQAVKPFMSSEDIALGTRWSVEIASELEASEFGLICVTAENQDAPWVNFEAGALAKVMDKARVVPIAIDLEKALVRQPLGQFQTIEATEASFRKLVNQLNEQLETPIENSALGDTFEAFWPRLETRLRAAKEASSRPSPEKNIAASRSSNDEPSAVLMDVLNTVRDIARTQERFLRRFTAPSPDPSNRRNEEEMQTAFDLLSHRIRQITPIANVRMRDGHLTIETEPLSKNQLAALSRAIAKSGFSAASIDQTLTVPNSDAPPYGDEDPGAF